MIFTLAARTGTSPRGDVDALIELAADIAIHAELPRRAVSRAGYGTNRRAGVSLSCAVPFEGNGNDWFGMRDE